MKIKIPNNLKIFIFQKGFFVIIKFLNKNGVIKKKFNSKNLSFIKEEGNIINIAIINNIFTHNLNRLKKKKLFNKLYIYKLIINRIVLNMFKTAKDRLILEGIGYKVWKKKKF